MKKKPILRMDELPIYDITLEEDGTDGIRLVSLVAQPAIEVMGMCFSAEEKEIHKNFEFKKMEDQQIIVGPALIPDRKILRRNPNNKDDAYYVRFSKDVIRKLVDRFNKNNNNKSINLDHSDTMVNGYIRENWVIQSATYDKSKFYGFNDLPVGSWFIEVKIDDEQLWKNEVKDGGKYGFSIEGILSQELVDYEMTFEKEYEELVKLYNLFILLDDIPVHPNCQCEIDNGLWLIMSNACNECRELQSEFNALIAAGDTEMALQIFNRHKFGK